MTNVTKLCFTKAVLIFENHVKKYEVNNDII